MKNHEWVDGRLLQTNKKWSALKQKQRELIYELTRKQHALYVEREGKLPLKKHKKEMISIVYSQIEERGIWIQYSEFHSRVSIYIDRLNRKHPLSKSSSSDEDLDTTQQTHSSKTE